MAVKALLKEAMNAHLESQREWVSTQVLPSQTAPAVTFNTIGGDDVQYIAPTNGWIEIDFAIVNATVPEVITCGIQTTTLTYSQRKHHQKAARCLILAIAGFIPGTAITEQARS